MPRKSYTASVTALIRSGETSMPYRSCKLSDDLARAHAAGVHRDDLGIEPREAVLVVGEQLRVETNLAVTRNLQLDLARVGDDCLLP